MPLALYAIVQMVTSPALVLVEEDSVLNKHVSALRVPSLGYSVRTFEEQASLDRFGRPHPGPVPRMAIHRNLASLSKRAQEAYCSTPIDGFWNHVENLTEGELFAYPAGDWKQPQSATIRLSGNPSAVALVLEDGSQINVSGIMEALGFHFQSGGQL